MLVSPSAQDSEYESWTDAVYDTDDSEVEDAEMFRAVAGLDGTDEK